MTKLFHALLLCGLFIGCCFAQTPALKVLPWNDHPGAASLTFDDARPVHLDVVVPELNKRHLRGTFFVIISKLTRSDDWRKTQLQGHEVGNHSVSHEHPVALSKESEEKQVGDAPKVHGEKKFAWEAPTPVPHGVVLKIMVDGTSRPLTQSHV